MSQAERKWKAFEARFSIPEAHVDKPVKERTFKVEYARSGRATCLECDALIEEGTVRVAVEEWEPAGTFTFTKWRHLPCFRKPKELQSAAEIRGIEALELEDQTALRKHIDKQIEYWRQRGNDLVREGLSVPALVVPDAGPLEIRDGTQAPIIAEEPSNKMEGLNPLTSSPSSTVTVDKPITTNARSFSETVREMHAESLTMKEKGSSGHPYARNDERLVKGYGESFARTRAYGAADNSAGNYAGSSRGGNSRYSVKADEEDEIVYAESSSEAEEGQENSSDGSEEDEDEGQSDFASDSSSSDEDEDDFVYQVRPTRRQRGGTGTQDPYSRSRFAQRDAAQLRRRPSTQRARGLMASKDAANQQRHSVHQFVGVLRVRGELRFPNDCDSILSSFGAPTSLALAAKVADHGRFSPLAPLGLGFQFGNQIRPRSQLCTLHEIPFTHTVSSSVESQELQETTLQRPIDPMFGTLPSTLSESERNEVNQLRALLNALRDTLADAHLAYSDRKQVYKDLDEALHRIVQVTSTSRH